MQGTGQPIPDPDPQANNPFQFVDHFIRDKHLFELPGFERSTNGQHRVQDDEAFRKVFEFLTQPWWTRLWCVQEILLVPDALMVFGKWRITWSALKAAAVNHRRHIGSCCSETQMLLSPSLWFLKDDDIVDKPQYAKSDDAYYYDLDWLLRVYSHRKCKDPRDKVYGLLGLVDMSKYPGLVPDYTKTLSAVYHDATMAVYHRNPRSLRFLTGRCSPDTVEGDDVPSWIRNFPGESDITTTWCEKHRLKLYDLYQAAATTTARATFIDKTKLRLRGTRISSITAIGAVLTIVNIPDYISTIKSWLQLAGLEAPNGLDELQTPRQKQFWRTLIVDAAFDSDPSDLKYVWRRTTDVDMHKYLETITKFLQLNSCPASGFKPALARIMVMACLGKAFFITREGDMGLCYPEAGIGDEVWVLNGGNVPFVLRPEGREPGSYRFVGDCYLDGYMDGQAVNDPEHEVKDVVLV